VTDFDIVIVGAGAAGCVLAYRLSEDAGCRVALVEAGPPDRHPLIHVPKGLPKIMANPAYLWAYASAPEAANAMTPETWVRGRVLGGSTSVSGMMYVRGQPADYDAIAAQSSDDWSWRQIGAAFAALECHELGAAETRGANGPLHVTLPTVRDALSEAMIAAGEKLGWTQLVDTNEPVDAEGIGYAPRTIHRGRRWSAAQAFLRPALRRPNLTLFTGASAAQIVWSGKRAAGVELLRRGRKEILSAQREVILAAGALASPGILERSGIGDPGRLAALGIPVVAPLPAVGEGLIEHRAIIVQWRLDADVSHNKRYYGAGLMASIVEYALTRGGPMSAAAYELGAWFKTDPRLPRPDAQFLLAPFSFDFAKQRKDVERFPGFHITAYPLRPTSRGRVHVTSRDPSAALALETNYRATAEDRAAMVGAVRVARRLAEQAPLAAFGPRETMPGPSFASDEQILSAYDRFGTCGYHAVGSCRMGRDADSVVDPSLRVRGVEGLRVVDASILPAIPSGNTTAPIYAMAWRAADVIRRD
jgi:choline dehydrogenase-like flavoprotein